MGQASYSRISIILICFLIVGAFIYRQIPSHIFEKQISLNQALSNLEGWKKNSNFNLDQKVVDALELDQYLSQSYTNGKVNISLFVGYYLTAKKIGAIHSPLVCYPGQGWVISDVTQKFVKVNDDKIDFTVMIVNKGQEKDLVIYWFQAFDKTSNGTFFQKILLFWSKFFHSREDNAFVRVSISLNSLTTESSYDQGIKFINAFYPRFVEYIRS